ncbi:MAG: hypothetical protein HC877_01690 [Thioploca sp.]|nr:hypothetical protein [Thioploca sp.]
MNPFDKYKQLTLRTQEDFVARYGQSGEQNLVLQLTAHHEAFWVILRSVPVGNN